MNIGTLENALKIFIEEKTKDLKFPTKDKHEGERPAKIFSGFLPPNTATDEIPAVAIRFNKGSDAPEERYLYFDFYFAIYNKNPSDGYKGLVLLVERVINEITKQKIIGDYFAYEDIAEFVVDDEQPYPYWVANARMKFSSPRVDYTGG